MPYDIVTTPVVGNATKRSDYVRLRDNIIALQDGSQAHAALTVTGAATIGGTLGVTGSITTSGNMNALGGTAVVGSLRVDTTNPLIEYNVQGSPATARRWFIQGLTNGLRYFVADDDLTGQFDYDTLTRLGPSITGRLIGLASGGNGFRVAVGGSGTTVRLTVSDTAITAGVPIAPTRINSGSAQPGFLAVQTAGAAAGTIPWDTEVEDTTGNFSGGVFTAPVAGKYLFTVVVRSANAPDAQMSVILVTPTQSYGSVAHMPTVGMVGTCTIAVTVQLALGANVFVTNTANTIGTVAEARAYFSGRLLV